MPLVMLASGRLRTFVLGLTTGVRLPGSHVLKRVLRRPAPVAYRHHRLAAVAVSRLTDLRRGTVRGDGAHVIPVRPVSRQRGDGREITRSGRVEPLDRPAVDAVVLLVSLGLVILLVSFGLVILGAGQDASRGDARHGEDEHDQECQNASFQTGSRCPTGQRAGCRSWPVKRPIGHFGAGRCTTLGDIQSCGKPKVAAVLPTKVVHPDRHQLLEVALRIALEGGIGKGDPTLCLLAEEHLDGAAWMDRT